MNRNRQRGMTLINYAVMLTALMGMAGLAVDVGVLYTARTSAQHAADAAALAGAYTFVNPANAQPSSAQNAAVATAAQTRVIGNPVTITAANVSVDLANQVVTVTVPLSGASAVRTFFAAAMGFTSANITVQASAEAWKIGTASRCLKPIFIPNTILAPTADTPGKGGTWPTSKACTNKEIVFANDGSGNFVPSAYSTSHMPTAPGSPLSITPSDPATALTSSQFFELDLSATPPGGGASLFRCTLGSCLNDCAGAASVGACGASLPVLTGARFGPVKQGVDNLVGNPATDSYIGPGQYQTPYGVLDTSRALAIAPIWDNCDPANQISPGYKGQTVKIIGFVEIFVSGLKGNAVQAYFVRPVQCAAAGTTGPGGAPITGPLGAPIRLIQTP